MEEDEAVGGVEEVSTEEHVGTEGVGRRVEVEKAEEAGGMERVSVVEEAEEANRVEEALDLSRLSAGNTLGDGGTMFTRVFLDGVQSVLSSVDESLSLPIA